MGSTAIGLSTRAKVAPPRLQGPHKCKWRRQRRQAASARTCCRPAEDELPLQNITMSFVFRQHPI